MRHPRGETYTDVYGYARSNVFFGRYRYDGLYRVNSVGVIIAPGCHILILV